MIQNIENPMPSDDNFFHNAVHTSINKERIIVRFSSEIKNELTNTVSVDHNAVLYLKPDMIEGLISILLNVAVQYNKEFDTNLLGLNELMKSAEENKDAAAQEK